MMSSSQAPKKSNHQANVVRIPEILPHSNADTLEIIRIGWNENGYQVVVKKGQFKAGDLAVYIQPDSVVPMTEPFRFIWEPYLLQPVEKMSQAEVYDYPVPERRRRITVRKFRNEWSEGLLLPISEFPALYADKVPAEGQDVSDILGITHYDPDRGVEKTSGESESAPRRKHPKTIKGWFFFVLHKLGLKSAGKQLTQEVQFDLPVYDVEAFKNYQNVFKPDETVIVTEKIHGSSARFVCIDGTMYAGSRNFWKSPKSNCIWRKALKQNPWIEDFCRQFPGYALYGEVTPTQKGYNYGCKEGEVRFFVFDVRTPEGEWFDKYHDNTIIAQTLDMMQDQGCFVPLLMCDYFNMGDIMELVDGPSQVPGAKHMREGVVIKSMNERHVRGAGRAQLKIVSNKFLEKDSK